MTGEQTGFDGAGGRQAGWDGAHQQQFDSGTAFHGGPIVDHQAAGVVDEYSELQEADLISAQGHAGGHLAAHEHDVMVARPQHAEVRRPVDAGVGHGAGGGGHQQDVCEEQAAQHCDEDVGEDDEGDDGPVGMPIKVKVMFGIGGLFIAGIVGLGIFGAGAGTGHSHGGGEMSRATVEPVQVAGQQRGGTVVVDPMTAAANMPVRGAVAGGAEDGGDPAPRAGDVGNGLVGNGAGGMQAQEAGVNAAAVEGLAADVRGLREAQNDLQSTVGVREGATDDAIKAIAGRFTVVDNEIAELSVKIDALTPVAPAASVPGHAPHGKKPKMAKENGGSAAASASTPRNSHEKRHRRDVTEAVAAGCVLKGGSDGQFEGDGKPRAWISTAAGDMAAKSVGDAAPCVGVIKSIRADGDDWVVIGSKASLRLQAGAGE